MLAVRRPRSSDLGLGELANSLAHLRERLLQIGEVFVLGLRELLRKPPLAQLQQQLLGSLLVDALGLGASVEPRA